MAIFFKSPRCCTSRVERAMGFACQVGKMPIVFWFVYSSMEFLLHICKTVSITSFCKIPKV